MPTRPLPANLTTTVRKKCHTKFYHRGIRVHKFITSPVITIINNTFWQICLNSFLFLHCMGRWRYEAIKKNCLSEGIQERVHGNSKHLPHNEFTTDELKSIVFFMQNYAEENAILLPGRIPGYKRTDLQLLPTNTTKRQVWECYVQSCATLTLRMAGYTRFCFFVAEIRAPHLDHHSENRSLLELPTKLLPDHIL